MAHRSARFDVVAIALLTLLGAVGAIGLMGAGGCGDPVDSDSDSGTNIDVGNSDVSDDLVFLDGDDAGDTNVNGDRVLTLSISSNSIELDGSATVEATVMVGDVAAADRTTVLLSVTTDNAFVGSEGSRALQRGTVGGVASVEILPELPGTVEITAQVDFADGIRLTDTISLEVTGTLGNARITLTTPTLDGTMFIAGGDPLLLQAEAVTAQGRPADLALIRFYVTAGRVFASLENWNGWSQVDIPTDSQGRAFAYFDPLVSRGEITVRAALVIDTQEVRSDSIQLTVVSQGTIAFVEASANPMGMVDSGFSETSTLTFRLTDLSNAPIDGQTVDLALETALPAELSAETAVTDEDGRFSVDVSSTAPGTLVVVPTTDLDGIVIGGRSDTITVVSGRPVGRFSRLFCPPLNVIGVEALLGDGTVSVRCEGTLFDRRQGPLMVPATVFLAAEVGTVPESVTTDAEGLFSFDWVIDEFPDDTVPYEDGGERLEPLFDPVEETESNVRDQVARVIFWTEGEEWFVDRNGDGERDPGEAFWDYGEPFLDRNDSTTRDDGEVFADAPWGLPGRHDIGNLEYDPITTIWADAMLVISGEPSDAETGEGSDRDHYSSWIIGGVEVGDDEIPQVLDNERAYLDLYLVDEYGAPIQAGAQISVEVVDCDNILELETLASYEMGQRLGFTEIEVQSPVGTGWSTQRFLANFDVMTQHNVRVRNRAGGEAGSCELRVTVEYASCNGCEDQNTFTTSITLEAL